MENNGKKLYLFYVIFFYIFFVNPSYNILKLKEKKQKEEENLVLIYKNNEYLKEKLKKTSKNEIKEIKNGKKLFANIGKYNNYINYYIERNNLKVNYIGRSIYEGERLSVSYELEGNLLDFIGFLNEISTEGKIYLNSGNFHLEVEEERIKAKINLEGEIEILNQRGKK